MEALRTVACAGGAWPRFLIPPLLVPQVKALPQMPEPSEVLIALGACTRLPEIKKVLPLMPLGGSWRLLVSVILWLSSFPSLSSTVSSARPHLHRSVLFFFFPVLRILLVACGLTKGEKTQKKQKPRGDPVNLQVIFWCILASFCMIGPHSDHL